MMESWASLFFGAIFLSIITLRIFRSVFAWLEGR